MATGWEFHCEEAGHTLRNRWGESIHPFSKRQPREIKLETAVVERMDAKKKEEKYIHFMTALS